MLYKSILVGLLCLLVLGCNTPIEPPPLLAESTLEPLPVVTVPSTSTVVFDTGEPMVSAELTSTPLPSPTPISLPTETGPQRAPLPTNVWSELATGLSHRVLPVRDAAGVEAEQLYVLRIDPTHYRFDVAYRPTEPLTLPEWLDETGALIVLNGGFFTAEYYATGLTIADGVPSGVSYDFGGMASIRDGVLNLQPLSAEPYNPNNPPDAGLQAFPMLVNRDGTAAFTEPAVNRARRTIIAQDRSGHVLFMLANRNYFTLTELSRFLAASDLDLAIAFNLDGGPSSGLLIRDPQLAIPSPVLLPTVLTVYQK